MRAAGIRVQNCCSFTSLLCSIIDSQPSALVNIKSSDYKTVGGPGISTSSCTQATSSSLYPPTLTRVSVRRNAVSTPTSTPVAVFNSYSIFDSDDDLEIIEEDPPSFKATGVSSSTTIVSDSESLDDVVSIYPSDSFQTPTSTLSSNSLFTSPDDTGVHVPPSPPHSGPLFSGGVDVDELELPPDYEAYHNGYDALANASLEGVPALCDEDVCFRIPKRKRQFVMKLAKLELGLHSSMQSIEDGGPSTLVICFTTT